MEIALLLLFLGLIFGLISTAVSAEKRKGLGFLLGFLLGPLGILIAAIACRQPRDPQVIYYPAAGPARNTATHSNHSTLADTPSQLTIKRDRKIIGTWPLADALDLLNAGTLLPDDQYLHNEKPETWRLLSRLL